MKSFVCAMLLAVIALLPGACNRSGESHQVGHLAPRTRQDAAEGQRQIAAVGMVVDDDNANEANRIEKRPITVIHADTGADIDAFAFQATRLMSVNRVVGLIGGV